MASKLMEAKDKVRELSKKALDVTEDSSLTPVEQKTALDKIEPEIKEWCDTVSALEHIEQKRKEFLEATGQTVDDTASVNDRKATAKSLGAQFVDSANYKALVKKGFNGKWTSGDIELKDTFSEGTATEPGGGYSPATIRPNVLPGVVDIRFQELMIEDLFPGGATDSPLIRYLVETAVTNAATAVAEGQLKPESAIEFDQVDETLTKVPTFLPITDEMLEDWSQTLSYINARLMLFVRQAVEVQLLSGDGTGANMVGLLNRDGLAATITKGSAPSASDDNSMDAVYRQITRIRTTAFLEPDAIVTNPEAWEGIILSKNAQGAYYANGPFVGQQPQTLWGKKVANTIAMPQHNALVGAFAQAAQVFTKGGLTVEASNSHNDFFQRNLTALRAEVRKALAVYRPGAFGLVDGLD